MDESPQNEKTEFYPQSPYAIAKLYGHWSTINYRESHDMYATSGILFNHESPRRGEEFITGKITLGAPRIREGEQTELRLGNLNAKRDWGHSRDYVRAMHQILQQEKDKMTDYVIETGKIHTVRKCAKIAFDELGLDYRDYIVVDEEFFRPAEMNVLQADSSAAKEKLSWEPEISFEEIIREMARRDHSRIKKNDRYWTQPDSDFGLEPSIADY